MTWTKFGSICLPLLHQRTAVGHSLTSSSLTLTTRRGQPLSFSQRNRLVISVKKNLSGMEALKCQQVGQCTLLVRQWGVLFEVNSVLWSSAESPSLSLSLDHFKWFRFPQILPSKFYVLIRRDHISLTTRQWSADMRGMITHLLIGIDLLIWHARN